METLIKATLVLLAAMSLAACGSSAGGNADAGTLTAVPAPLSFDAVGATQKVVASESGYKGMLTAEAVGCDGIATVSPASAGGPSAIFSVVSVAAGKCVVNIADVQGNVAPVVVDVTTVAAGVN